MKRYELKLAGGKVVEWEGRDGEEAARRYTDARRVAGEHVVVLAWREPRVGIYVFGRHGRIIE